ncbi:PHP domain-containing protein [candidate division WOR-3 bacterium]|nr:PHP domain-containing protein [candidate division WOR-3 bacterium]
MKRNHLSNPFKIKGNWYKGNLHTHTTNSDGDLSPEEAVAWYKDRSYDFLAITDHGKITKVEKKFPDFLLIEGVEIGAEKAELGQGYHIVCLNISDLPELKEVPSVQEVIDIVRERGGKLIIGHPYWSALTFSDIISLSNEILGIEIFNSTCDLAIGKGFSTVHWDDLLIRGKKVYGFAVDDSHNFTAAPFDAGAGWIMVKAKHLTKENILEALEEGDFYSSCGPIIKDISIDGNGKIKVSCTPVVRINFICDRTSGKVFRAEKGSSLTKAEVTLGEVKYVRVECIDKEGMAAWSNPFFLKKWA